MTVILKDNPIQDGLSKAQGWQGANKKAYVGVRETNVV